MIYKLSIQNRMNPTPPGANFFDFQGLTKVSIIKALRNATDLGLREAKLLSEELEGHEYITIDVTNSRLNQTTALNNLREEGLVAERSMDDPISLLRKAADEALNANDIDFAIDILTLIKGHSNV